MKSILRAAFIATALLSASAAGAQSQGGGTPDGNYPNRPVKILLPFPPGGVADVVGRLLAQKPLSMAWWFRDCPSSRLMQFFPPPSRNCDHRHRGLMQFNK